MIRTQYYVTSRFGVPQFSGPDELSVLGQWVTADIQLVPLAILEAIDLVAEAKADPGFAPEDLDGNAHTTTISPQGVRVENSFVEHVQGDFTLDDAFRVLVDFWDFCHQANPAKADARRREYAHEHRRDPLAGIRDIQATAFEIRPGRTASTPRLTGVAADLADAVGGMYAAEAEDAVLVWNQVPIRLTYRYDIPVLLGDLVPLLEEVRRPEFAAAEVFWGSDTFCAEWMLTREGDDVHIRARWHGTLGSHESSLAERGDVTVAAGEFVSEWCEVLRRIVHDVEAGSVELADDGLLVRAKALLGDNNDQAAGGNTA
ncbi:hypothetical protein AB0N28_26645 [Streptomyces sp. NPDC051130]|uniref:hypothetical protein n=1 Tax=Streptomyces sp. NPDC051130 TaxID=3157223 RepID=UPI003436527B